MAHKKEHIIPIKVYLSVAALLYVLTAITVGVSFIDLGGFNAVAAVGIATIKALLVAFIFMHLLYDNKMNLFIFSIALVMVSLFIAITMFDTLRRADLYDVSGGPINKKARMYDNMKPDSTNHSTHKDHE